MESTIPNFIDWESKLPELLHSITSVDCISGPRHTYEFILFLREEDLGWELISRYISSSPQCSELLYAWKLRQGKDELSYICLIIALVLNHHRGKSGSTISRQLDDFAGTIVREYLPDVYIAMDSTEIWCQECALLLMYSIVRRGPSLADKVLESFDFTKLSESFSESRWLMTWNTSERSLREAYVGFAMSFLEVGDPGLLSRALQQKQMYSGVLHPLSYDNDRTLNYVLYTLRDTLLLQESLVPPSSLFRTLALHQLVHISARGAWDRQGAELAYNFLALACTDPCNGLMPDLNRGLEGNMKRISKLMKALNPFKAQYHKDLLVAIVNGRPYFGFLYLKELPFSFKKFKSPSWVEAVGLATDLICLISDGLFSESLNSLTHQLNIQELLEWMFSSFSPSLIRKGLLHDCIRARHAVVRLLLELQKLLETIFDCRSSSTSEIIQCAESIKQGIQNFVQSFLPGLRRNLLPLRCSGHSCAWGFTNPAFYWEANSREEFVIGAVGKIWGMGMSFSSEEVEDYVHSKVQEALHCLQPLQATQHIKEHEGPCDYWDLKAKAKSKHSRKHAAHRQHMKRKKADNRRKESEMLTGELKYLKNIHVLY